MWQSRNHLDILVRPNLIKQFNLLVLQPPNFIQICPKAHPQYHITVLSLFSALDNPCPSKVLHSWILRTKYHFVCVKYYQKSCTGQDLSFLSKLIPLESTLIILLYRSQDRYLFPPHDQEYPEHQYDLSEFNLFFTISNQIPFRWKKKDMEISLMGRETNIALF